MFSQEHTQVPNVPMFSQGPVLLIVYIYHYCLRVLLHQLGFYHGFASSWRKLADQHPDTKPRFESNFLYKNIKYITDSGYSLPLEGCYVTYNVTYLTSGVFPWIHSGYCYQ